MEIIYKEEIPDIEMIIDLFNHSDYYPVEDKSDIERIQKMFEKANVVITAWDHTHL